MCNTHSVMSHPMKTSLPEYIARVGDVAAANLFGVKRRTVESWRRGERVPRPSQANKIVRLTGGEVDFSSIYRKQEAA